MGRRSVLRSLCGIGTITTIAPVSAGGRGDPPDVGDMQSLSESEPPPIDGHSSRPDGYVATVDRIVDGTHVVLLLEDDGDVVDQLVVEPAALPPVAEGDVLSVVLSCRGDELVDVRRLDDETERRRREARDRLDRLTNSSSE